MPDNVVETLFILNPSAGTSKTDWKQEITDFFHDKNQSYTIFELTGKDDTPAIKDKIVELKPGKVIAVGGDGTVKMVAEQLLHTEMILGILPAGSANGMATELGISNDPSQALETVLSGEVKKIDVIQVNDGNLCIHLSDLGLNAMLVHYFDQGNRRGMLGYAKVAFKVFLRRRLMRLEISTDGNTISRGAYMVVLANAKTYGTGAVINPQGSISDGKFEVIIMRRMNLVHLFRMLVSHAPFNDDCIETIHAQKVIITSSKKNYFQIDGEYCGKQNKITAEIKPLSLNVLMPAGDK